MLVVGLRGSANTRNLEIVCRQGITAKHGMVEPWSVSLVQDESQVGAALALWFQDNGMAFPKVGVTAGTSTPIEVVERVVARLKEV